MSNHKPPRLRLIRYCGRGHATVRFRGKTYELLSGHCGRPMKSRSPRRGTESLRHILFGLHGARRPSAEGELWLVPRPGNRPGRVTIDDGEISAGGVRMLPHFGGGTAFVEAGLTSGTFRSMATLMNLFQTGTVQKRELVTGSWDCG